MSATVTLTLDTHAPDVTFGAVGGNTAGELLQIAYTASEPVADATLVRSGRRLALTVWSDRFEGLVPVDWIDGPADIEVVDDVGNAVLYTAAVTISSPITGPAPAPGASSSHSTFGAPPARRRSPPLPVVRDVESTTPVALRSRADVQAAPTSSTPVAVGSAARVAVSAVVSQLLILRDTATVHVTVTADIAIHATGVATVTKRDGPDIEEAVILGLLG